MMFAKPHALAIAAALAAITIAAASIPAVAKDKQTPGYQTCFDLSVERGSGPAKGGDARKESQHKDFVAQCMAGKILLSPAEARRFAAKLPANTYASTVVSKPANRHSGSAR